MVTIVDPSGNCSAARSASGSSHIWVYTSRRNQNAKSLSQTVASSCPLLLRTASAISCVFIHPPNQQSDDAIARALQFCDSGQKRRRRNTLFRGQSRNRPPVTPLSREHQKERTTHAIKRCMDACISFRDRRRYLVAGRSHRPHEQDVSPAAPHL